MLAQTGTPEFALPLIDWVAGGICVLGLVAGYAGGLGRAFGMLLWLLAALWLGSFLAERVVSWLPNSAEPGDAGALALAYASIAALVLSLPVLGRILGGAAGKKKEGGEASHKAFGALVGLVAAALLLTLALPWLRRIGPLGEGYDAAHAPALAATVAENVGYLFPPYHPL